MDKHCGNCKYCGEVLEDNLHRCNNNKSIFKTCLETATGCEKFDPQDNDITWYDRRYYSDIMVKTQESEG